MNRMPRLAEPFAGRRRPLTLAAVLAAGALVQGCATPAHGTRVTRVIEEPARTTVVVTERHGTVERIERVETEAGNAPSGAGAVLGGLLGGAVGSQVGHGSGRAAATVLGVFGGAVAGNEIEQREAGTTWHHHWHVVVRFDDGARRGYDYRELAGLRVGDSVRLHDGVLMRA